MNEIMCSGGWWVCFQYYLYKIKKLLENGSNCPFSCLDFYTSYLRMSVLPQRHIHERCQLPGSFTE